MSGPDRSASIASHFDKYINSNATFKDFFELYMKFMQHRCDMEAKDDLESQSERPTLRSPLAFGKQLSMIYTDTVFKKFQAEVLGVVSCQLQSERENGTTKIFCVEDFEERQNFFVAWNKGLLDVRCSCRLFEYQGFLCKHAILVIQNSDVSCIPPQYILKRGSKNGNNKEDKNKNYATIHNQMARFDDLCRRFVKLGEVASLSDEAYKTVLMFLEESLTHFVSVNNSSKFHSESDKLLTGGAKDQVDDASRFPKKKKIHKKRKAYYGPKDATSRPEELCQDTEQVNSRTPPTFENCYIRQGDMGDTELGSRAANLGVYYPNQRIIQGFSTVPLLQDGYYGHPPAIPSIGSMQFINIRMSQYETRTKLPRR